MPARLIESLGTTDALAGVFSDESVLGAMLQFETALARAQARLEMIPHHAVEAIEKAAAARAFDCAELAREARRSAVVAVPFVTALAMRVREIDSRSEAFVHWGATSQDVMDTALVLLLRRAREVVAADHTRLARALRRLAGEYSETIMLSRTLLQPAPPTTFGYKAAGWYGAVHRSWRRVSRSFEEALLLQFGGASGTLASYGDRGPALAAEVGKELGLAAPPAPWHTHRDRLAGVVADTAIYTGSLAKIARDITLLGQHEIGEVAAPGGSSSAMPDKRNPVGPVIALAAATRAPALVAAYLAGMVQEQERAAGGWQAEWETVTALVQTAGSALAAIADTMDGLTVKPERMRANLEATGGAVFAEKAAMLLAPKLGRAAARKVLAQSGDGRPLREALQAHLTPDQLDSIDRPEQYLGAAEVFRQRLLDHKE